MDHHHPHWGKLIIVPYRNPLVLLFFCCYYYDDKWISHTLPNSGFPGEKLSLCTHTWRVTTISLCVFLPRFSNRKGGISVLNTLILNVCPMTCLFIYQTFGGCFAITRLHQRTRVEHLMGAHYDLQCYQRNNSLPALNHKNQQQRNYDKNTLLCIILDEWTYNITIMMGHQ